MRFFVFLIIITLLSSCTPLTPEQAYQQEYDATKMYSYHEFDEYSKSYKSSSPSDGGGLFSDLTTPANIQNQILFQDDKYVLYSKLSAMDWYFISKAEVLGVGEVDLYNVDRQVRSGDRVIEKVGIVLTPDLIEYAKINGLQVRYSGKRGRLETKLTKAYVNGFIDSVAENQAGKNKQE